MLTIFYINPPSWEGTPDERADIECLSEFGKVVTQDEAWFQQEIRKYTSKGQIPQENIFARYIQTEADVVAFRGYKNLVQPYIPGGMGRLLLEAQLYRKPIWEMRNANEMTTVFADKFPVVELNDIMSRKETIAAFEEKRI